MALETIIKIINSFLAMLRRGFCLVMAGIAGPRGQGGLVAISANARIAMIHREDVRPIVTGWPPGRGGMAGRTSLSREHACMVSRVNMAGRALCWGSFENTVFMAIFTAHIHMRALQRKSRQVMVKRGIVPI